MELQVNPIQIPESITFNYDQLKAELLDTLKSYEVSVYTADQMKQAKADKANLNKLKKALNDERIRREREYMAPFMDFKTKITELVCLIDKPVAAIDSQVKAYEEQKKVEKREAIEQLYEDEFKTQFPDWLKLEQIFVQSWLNASCSMKTVRDDLTGMRDTMYSDLLAINEMPDFSFEALEIYKTTLKLTAAINEGKRLADIQKRKEEQERIRKETEAARIAAENEKRLAEEAAQAVADIAETVAAAGAVMAGAEPQSEGIKIQKQWISFRCLLTVPQAKELRKFFEDNGIEFHSI